MQTRAERQAAARREVRMKPKIKRKISKWATEHMMSRSEVVRFVMQQAEEMKITPFEKRTERVVYYDPDGLTDSFARKAAAAGTEAPELFEMIVMEKL